jgi:hypothetical protein
VGPVVAGDDVQWFEESVVSAPVEAIPPTRYAVRSVPGEPPVVVAGNFCLSPSLCFAWERLPRLGSPGQAAAMAPDPQASARRPSATEGGDATR